MNEESIKVTLGFMCANVSSEWNRIQITNEQNAAAKAHTHAWNMSSTMCKEKGENVTHLTMQIEKNKGFSRGERKKQ